MEEIGLTSSMNRRMSISDYQWTFQNPFYYGVMKFKGQLYEGKHEPIISKRLFDRVQEVMAQKSKPKTPLLKPYLYRGLFRCGECGCFITTETQKGHNYLRCTKRVSACTQKYVREEAIATQVDRAIERVTLEAALADQMVRELEQERETASRGQEAAVERCKAELAACEEQIDLLLDMRLSRQISEPEYVSKKHILVNQKAELKGKLEAYERNRANRFEPAKGVPDFVIFADGGRVFAIECKPAKGKLTPEQAGWRMMLQRNGHKFAVVRSMTEFLGAVETWLNQ
jgi:hypothetical protein